VNVLRLAIAPHPMLRELAAYLATVAPPSPPYDEHGDWRADIAAGPPLEDRPKPLHYRRQFMKTPIRLPSMPDDTIVSALNYYPAGGAGLGWHTDRAEGWRVYIGLPLTNVAGCFITREALFYDVDGFAVAFEAGPQSWHAVRADGPRLSIGLRIRGGRTARLLGLF
jgi:hypothetical protein